MYKLTLFTQITCSSWLKESQFYTFIKLYNIVSIVRGKILAEENTGGFGES